MSYTKIIMSAAAFGLMSSTALAQYNTVVEPVTQPVQTVDQLPIEYNEQGVMKAQHIRIGDVSPEEYNRLLAEADKIRAFQSNSGNYSSSSYETYVAPQASESTGYEVQLFEEAVSQPAPVTYAATTPYYSSGSIIQQPAYTTTQVSVPVMNSHSVAKGDTLYNISKRFGVSVDEIKIANSLRSNDLKLGQFLQIPNNTTTVFAQTQQNAPLLAVSTAPATVIAQPASSQYSNSRVIRTVQPIPEDSNVYAVLPKDNLYQISKRTCTSVDSIVNLNRITDVTALQPGQKLLMPEGHCLK